MSLLDDLLKGRDHLEKSKWIQGSIGGIADSLGHHAHCMGGAIVCDMEWATANLRFTIINRFVAPLTGNLGIPFWNDMKGRTKSDVLALFDKAIEMAMALEHPPEPVLRTVRQDVRASGASVSEQLVLVTT